MNNPSAEYGNISLCGTIFLGIVSWLTPEKIDMGLKIITGLGALISAILAARYYWYATKEKKRSIKEYDDRDRSNNGSMQVKQKSSKNEDK